jgi:hypothetical protein
MKRLIQRFGKLITTSFVVMAIGIFLFLLNFPLYTNFRIDIDVIGLTVFLVGLAIFITGLLWRKKPKGWKIWIIVIGAIVLLMFILPFIASLIYYFVTGKPLGG